jgi:predicted Zn-dependent protease
MRLRPSNRILSLQAAVLLAAAPCRAALPSVTDGQPFAQDFLIRQIEAARNAGNQYLERKALSRLVMIEADPVYRTELLRLDLAEDAANAEKAAKTAEDLCRTAPAAVCEEARAAVRESAEGVRSHFLQARLLATAGQYEKAAETLEKALGGAPSEVWNRIEYLQMLLLLPERKAAAAEELKKARSRFPGNRLLANRVSDILLRTEIGDRERAIRAKIANRDSRMEGVADIEKLIAEHPEHERREFWEKLRTKGIFWQKIFDARQAVNAKEYAKAEALLAEAEQIVNPDELFNVRLVQAKIAIAQEDFERARAIYEETAEKTDIPEVKARLAELTEITFRKELMASVDRWEKEKNYAEVIGALTPLLKEQKDDAYLHFRIARAYQALDRNDAALKLFAGVPKSLLQTNRWAFFYALILAPLDKEWALAVLQGAKDADAKNRSMQAGLKKEILLAKIRRCYAEGDNACAKSLLAEIDDKAPDIIAIAARLAKADGDLSRALELFEMVAGEESMRREALLEEANILLAMDEKERAAEKLDALIKEDIPLEENQMLYAALLYRKAGGEEKSYGLLQSALKKNPDSDNPKLFDALGDALALRGDKAEALVNYKKTLFLKGALSSADAGDEEVTKLLLTPDAPPATDEEKEAAYLAQRVKNIYSTLVPTLTTGVSVIRSDGTPGYSDQTYSTVMVNYTQPYRDGELSLQTDYVRIDNGTLSSGRWKSMIGTCFNQGCTGDSVDRDAGVSVAVSFKDENWRWQIGSTPVGFHYQTVLGSLGYRTKIDENTVTGTVYRKAKSQSLLAFGGQKDPAADNNQWFGGVTRNGVRLDFSREFARDDGVWASASAELIRGHNVASNSSETLMGGYYRRLVNRPNFLWQTGANLMYMRYANNQNFYTWGNGGYWSPQRYISGGITSEVRYRTPRWSMAFSAGASVGQSNTSDSARYKMRDRIRAADAPLNLRIPDIDAVSKGKKSTNFGYSLEATVERRLSSRYVAGARVNWRHSPDWTPVSGMIYLRYYFRPWNGDLPMAPNPPTPFREWGGS